MVVVGSGCGGAVTGGGHSIFVQTGPPPLQVQVLQLWFQDSPASLSSPFMSTQAGLAVVVEEEDVGGAAVVVITLDYN